MAGGINKVILVGNLGQDPEIRYTADGRPIANFSIATSESWKDKNSGEKREKTEWHRVVVFGKLAEICGEYLSKGRQVYIEGKLQTRKWQGQDGQDRYTTEVVIDGFNGTMQMLGTREGGGGGPRAAAGTRSQRTANTHFFRRVYARHNSLPAAYTGYGMDSITAFFTAAARVLTLHDSPENVQGTYCDGTSQILPCAVIEAGNVSLPLPGSLIS